MTKTLWSKIKTILIKKKFSKIPTPSSTPTEPKWPNTSPPDKTDPNWKFNNNISMDGIPYHKIETQPNQWQWEVNREILTHIKEQECRRRNLYYSLLSRVLTDTEMEEVERYGDNLNIDLNVSFNSEKKKEELNAALLQQFKLRHIRDKGLKL